MASSLPCAVVDDAPLGRDVDCALLLLLGTLLKISVAENLQIDQAQANGAEPEKKETSQ